MAGSILAPWHFVNQAHLPHPSTIFHTSFLEGNDWHDVCFLPQCPGERSRGLQGPHRSLQCMCEECVREPCFHIISRWIAVTDWLLPDCLFYTLSFWEHSFIMLLYQHNVVCSFGGNYNRLWLLIVLLYLLQYYYIKCFFIQMYNNLGLGVTHIWV